MGYKKQGYKDEKTSNVLKRILKVIINKVNTFCGVLE
jgi:hypothetical protein